VTECARPSWSGSVDLGGWFMGAAGRAVWAMTPSGDVAWERSDALPLGFCAHKVVGKASDLAVVEAIAHGRPWVLGIEEDGSVRWKVPLPAPAPGCGAMDQVCALAPGRIFVARTDRVLAIAARSGRVVWMHARHAPASLARRLWGQSVPMDWRPPEGPERWRPDGRHGFQLSLTPGVLELTSGTGRRVERLDPRTGELLSSD
jgi:hypothetical protein